MPAIAITALLDVGADAPDTGASRITVVAPTDLAGVNSTTLGDATHVLVIGERRHETLVRRYAAALADRGPTVAWRTLPHGPGAILVLANQAASIGLDAGQSVAFLDALAGLTWSGAWTPSVANLTDPAPSLGEHLRSLTPGGKGFVVTLSGPNPSVDAVGKATVPEPGPDRGTLYCANPDLLPPAAREQLLAASRCSTVVEVPLMRVDVVGRLGTDRAVEAVALPGGGGVQLPAARGTCPTCATTVFTDFCPFCHVRRTDPSDFRGALA
ncbi:hypothetical protein [Cellulomonas sp. Leaf395]|jgi:hypothetical protein|uniref:hypothetical protein n=1 Tax=Cellulomonas sp. Leaf395 TaxID=1736362 RepID=UPI0006F3F3FD|nr:hypothetical protein [Cellulomonas sp. Leaf395]KQS99598.1 hypothetical protein ASG23_09530 [Cellulomonas sp. Leaf395]